MQAQPQLRQQQQQQQTTTAASGGTGPGGHGTSVSGGAAGMNMDASSTIVIPPEEVDFEFLPLIIEVLRLVEEGKANSDTVRQKVDYLQAKFTAAKTALELMDGADMSEEMQLETFDVYTARLNHFNTLMADYAKLPLFKR